MSNNEIVLDLMKRIIKLEKEVEELKENRAVNEDSNVKVLDKEVIRRSQLRDNLIHMLWQANSDKTDIRVSNRQEGSGITIEEKDGRKKSYILRTANNTTSDKSHGWFRIEEELVEKIVNKDLAGIILYSYYGDYEKDIIIIMNSKEFKDYIDRKGSQSKDANKNYHMYVKEEDGKIIEYRDDEIDISKYNKDFVI